MQKFDPQNKDPYIAYKKLRQSDFYPANENYIDVLETYNLPLLDVLRGTMSRTEEIVVCFVRFFFLLPSEKRLRLI